MSEQSFEMIAKTFQGLEETLAQELTSLGANEIQIGRRMVSFCGDKEMMYKANFCHPHPEAYQTVCSKKCR